MAKYLDKDGLGYFWTKIKNYVKDNQITIDSALNSASTNPVQNSAIYNALNNKVDKENGKGLSTNDYTAEEKTKLSGIEAGAEVNQYAFSKVKIGTTTIEADTKTDTLNLVAGDNITLDPVPSTDTITISASHRTYAGFTGTPTENQTPGWGKTFTIQQITQDATGAISGNNRTVKIPDGVASTSAAGLMSANDKKKLDGIASGAEVNQNAFSSVTVGSTTVTADGKTDSLILKAGSDKVSITADPDTDTITIDASGAVTGVKGDNQQSYRTGNVNITKDDIGLGLVTNDLDSNRDVRSATVLTTPRTIDGVSFDGSANIVHFGSCGTVAGTAIKVVSCTGFTLTSGAWIAVKFTVTNSAAVTSLQLNVNGTGGKPIKYRGGNLPSAGTLAANRVYLFVFDGTNYQLVGDLDSNGSYKAFTGGLTANQAPGWGQTFNAYQVKQDSSGAISEELRTVTIPNATASSNAAGLMSSTLYDKLTALPDATTLSNTYATKDDISAMYKYKGSVRTANNLPTSGQTAGDVYNIEEESIYGGAGMNVAWNGSAWDPLGEIFTIVSMTSDDIDEKCPLTDS